MVSGLLPAGEVKMIMEIKPLKDPVPLKLEQYGCEKCGEKFYINVDDKPRIAVCCFCGGFTKNTRLFDMEIKGIGEY